MSRLVRSLLIAIAAGILVGILFGTRTEYLGLAGTFTIRVLKTFAMPLLFFGIVDTFCKTRIAAQDGMRLLALSTLNACVALVIALTLAHWVPMETLLDLKALQEKLPKMNGLQPALAEHPGISGGGTSTTGWLSWKDPGLIPVVIFSLFVGITLRFMAVKSESKLARFFSGGYAVFQKILGFIVQFIPLAVFCIIAKIVGSSGLALLPVLAVFVAVVFLGMFFHSVVYYSCLLHFAGFSPRRFFDDAAAPLLTALSTGSSLATLPVTLHTLQEKMKIQPRYARLAAAIGTNLNHDGILLYEAMAALFVARLYGIPLSNSQQMTVAGTSVFAAVGIAGVPEAGLITLTLVLGAVGLPLQAAALLLPLDWLIGRLRATVNVASDMTVAHLLQRLGNPSTGSEPQPLSNNPK